MFFNPLFISNISSSTNSSANSAKGNKFSDSNYLFADIINISKETPDTSELKIKVGAENKSLFENLNIKTTENENSVETQFSGELSELDSFLSELLGSNTSKSNVLKKDKNNSADLSVVPEQINEIIEALNNGKSVSVPITNNGKEIFVEIQKVDKNSAGNNSGENIKSADTQSPLNEIDFNKVVSDISEALKASFSSGNFEMSNEKIDAIVNAIDSSFSKLEAVQNETLKPQKNVLGNLISSIEKDFQLNYSESTELKNVIVEQFVKVINENISAQNGKVSNSSTPKVISPDDFTSKLGLTSNEEKIVNELKTSVIIPSELKDKLEQKTSNATNSNEFQAILGKLEGYLGGMESKDLTISEISEELGLNSNEINLLKNIGIEKTSLPELSKAVSSELSKSTSSPVLKDFSQKLENYLASTEAKISSSVIQKELAIPEISKELKLNNNEINLLKNIGVEKTSLPELSKAVNSELFKSTNQPELKELSQKLENYLANNNSENGKVTDKLSLNEISEKLNLTKNESSLVDQLKLEKIDVDELQKSIKTEIVKSPNNLELKSLLGKVKNLDASLVNNNKKGIQESKTSVVEKVGKRKNTLIDKMKSGVKTVFNNSELNKSKTDLSKSEFTFTLKNDKSPDSLIMEGGTLVAKRVPELLRSSIYSSKESVELTKVKVVPIDEGVANKVEVKKSNNVLHKGKSVEDIKTNRVVDNQSKSSFENNASFAKEEFQNSEIISNKTLSEKTDELKPFEKIIAKSVDAESGKSSSEASKVIHKLVGNDARVDGDPFAKISSFETQLIKNELSITNKKEFRKLDVKNLNNELNNLIQKGEKKIVQFQLTPENLGKLEIRLEVVNKVVSASIKVDNEATQQLVQNSIDGLKTTLNQNGVQYNSINVSLSNSEEKQHGFFKHKKKKNNYTANMNVEGFDETFAPKKLGYNNYDFIA